MRRVWLYVLAQEMNGQRREGGDRVFSLQLYVVGLFSQERENGVLLISS